jgi:hypothetical protein
MIHALEGRLGQLDTTCVQIGDIVPRWTQTETSSGLARRRLSTIDVDGRPYGVTDRFTRSLALRFHVGSEFFRYFTPDEVFERIQQVHPRATVRLTTDGERALGMSNPAKPYVRPQELCRLLRGQRDRLVNLEYRDGVVRSTHRLDEAEWNVGRDAFASTFMFETPVDGVGLPSVYLSVIRMICTNGMIGYAPAFRTSIQLGKDLLDGAEGPLGRAMDCFSNEEGYAAFRERLDAARKSEASVYEVRMLCRALSRDFDPAKRASGQRIFERLWKLTGDLAVKYGVASEEAISRKKQSMLPMDCTVYDLLTFATEVGTHHSDKLRDKAQTIAWVGETLANEFDLEGSLIRNGGYEERETPTFYLN